MSVEQYKEASGLNGTEIVERKRKTRNMILIMGLLILLLIGGAFSAGRLFGNKAQVTEGQGGEVFKVDDDTMVGSGVMLKPDSRLPADPPTASGMLHHREDNTLYISQFPMTTGTVYLDQVDEWPIVEVVVTSDTQVYKDVTDISGSQAGGAIQQSVAPGSVDEIEEGSSLLAWGELHGERLIADVVQYW